MDSKVTTDPKPKPQLDELTQAVLKVQRILNKLGEPRKARAMRALNALCETESN